MPIILAILYHLRRVLFVALSLVMTLVLWLLMSDLIMRDPIGALMLKYLQIWYGFWPMFAHGIRGAMGIYPETPWAHWIITLSGLMIFFITQCLFLEPGRGWQRRLIHRTTASSYVYVMAALPAALLTVSLMASLLEAAGLWAYLPGNTHRIDGFIWQPQFTVVWFSLLVAWSVWANIFQNMFRRGDRYMQLAAMTYCLFVAASICLGVSAVVQIHMVGFTSAYWLSGSYTGMILSASVMLWTLIPGLTLIYAGKIYSTQRISLLRDGDQIGSQWFRIPAMASKPVA